MEKEGSNYRRLLEEAKKLKKQDFECVLISEPAEAILFKDKKDNYSVLVLKDGKYLYSISRVDKNKVSEDITDGKMAEIEDAFYKYKVPYSKQNEQLEAEAEKMLEEYTRNTTRLKVKIVKNESQK